MIAGMPEVIVFLRAVNVAGRFVKMADLRHTLEEAGFTGVESHIQSGNLLLRSRQRTTSAMASRVSTVLSQWAGFEIPAIVRTPTELNALVKRVEGIPPLLEPGGRRYLAFADRAIAGPAKEVLDGWDNPGERARVLDQDVLAELTIDFHKTRLTNARIERITGAVTTWRDFKVVREIAERWGETQ